MPSREFLYALLDFLVGAVDGIGASIWFRGLLATATASKQGRRLGPPSESHTGPGKKPMASQRLPCPPALSFVIEG